MRTSCVLLAVALCGARAAEPTVVYVAINGNDAWSGRLAAPNAAGTDGPFATLTRARDEVRKLKVDGPVTVRVRGGIYRLNETLQLEQADSGTADAPVVWEAAPGETVRFLGGARLTDWQPVSDPAVKARLTPAAREQVVQVDLADAGVKDLGRPAPVGGRAAQLICNSKYLPLARYPNEGEWLRVSGIPQGGTLVKTERASHYGRWAYDSDRPSHWQDVSDLWVHGYWVFDWRDEYQHVEKLDLDHQEVHPTQPYHHYGYKQGQRFYFLNILEELDSPGEWYLDRKAQRLYLWPPEKLDQAELIFPELQAPMVVLQDASYVRLRGFTFEGSRDLAARLNGGDHNELAGCTFRNFGGGTTVTVSGTNNGLRSCDLYEVAGTGVGLNGGDRQTLTPAGNYVVNCEIHHVGQVFRTYHPAVALSGVGNRIANCFIHDLPHEGIGYAGNDHVIENCEFTRIAEETGDVGVTYAAADWTYCGHEFRHNYFHNIHGPGNLGCFTIYPDLPCGGIYLHDNVFYDVDQVFHTNSGRGMVVENNLFLRCRGLSFSTWTRDEQFKPGGPWKMVEHLQAVHYDQPPYSTRYPMLRQLAKDFALGEDQILQRELPKDNLVRRNVSWGSGFFLSVHPTANLEMVRCEDNVIGNDVVFRGSLAGDGKGRSYNNGDAVVAAELGRRGNVIVSGNPGFEHLSEGSLALAPGSAALQRGFQPISLAGIGLQLDAYRQTLPRLADPPLLEPGSRSFAGELELNLLPTPQPGAATTVVRYTLDGTEPTIASASCEGTLKLSDSATVKAAAFVTSGNATTRSETVSGTYRAVTLEQGAVYLSDLEEQDLTAYRSCWVKDHNYQGGAISLGGREYLKGILLHPAEGEDGKGFGQVTYDLAGALAKARRFKATIGIDDAMDHYQKGSATFRVEVLRDGRWQQLYESPVLKLADEPLTIEVDLTGASKLRLTTTDGGDGIACDHAEWADARID